MAEIEGLPLVKMPIQLSEEDRKLFSDQASPLHPAYERIATLAEEGLVATFEEILTYALFEEWDDDVGASTYKYFARLLPERRKRLEDFTTLTKGELRFSRSPIRSISEAFGIGVTLTAASRVLGVSDVDFSMVTESSLGKSQDFQAQLVASNGTRIFQVEAKGTHDGKSSSKHRKSIREKKEQLREKGTEDALLGVIADISFERQKASYISIHDPPTVPRQEDPELLRVLIRLTNYLAEIKRISGRGALTVSLANRVAALEALGANLHLLDGVTLRKSNGEPLSPVLGERLSLGWWEGSAWGRTYDLRLLPSVLREERPIHTVSEHPPRLYFRGLHQQVLEHVVGQDQTAISALRFEPRAIRIDDGSTSGWVQITAGGVVAGVLTDAAWDEARLPKLIASLRK
ncbi:MAG: hypothetical protein KC619_33515 [Myxococcales bacterium]|nr:hypothetical protein [Myxococcales bacterium]